MSYLTKCKNRVQIPILEPSQIDSASRTSIMSTKPEPAKTPPSLAIKKSKNTQFYQIKSDSNIKSLNSNLSSRKNILQKLTVKSIKTQENYVKKEQEYRLILADYESKLTESEYAANTKLMDTTKQKVEEIQRDHKKIMGNLTEIQEKTVMLLRGQEIEIINDLNFKLKEKWEELEKERKAVNDNLARRGKESELMEELERLKSKVDDIDRKNKKYSQINFQVKIIQSSHSEDKKILMKQIETLKLHNKRLKAKLASANTGRLTPQPVLRDSSPSPEKDSFYQSSSYQDVITKLKKMIELESKNCRGAKTAFSRELEGRRELDKFLRDAVEDVKFKVLEKKSEQRMQNSNQEDLGRVIEILLSQERVLTLLYDKAFPHKMGRDSSRIDLGQMSFKGLPSLSALNNMEI